MTSIHSSDSVAYCRRATQKVRLREVKERVRRKDNGGQVGRNNVEKNEEKNEEKCKKTQRRSQSDRCYSTSLQLLHLFFSLFFSLHPPTLSVLHQMMV